MLETLKITLQENFEKLTQRVIRRFDAYTEELGPYIAQEVIHAMGLSVTPLPQPNQNPLPVHPNLLSAVSELLPHKDYDNYTWTCPEQAELVQSCMTDNHVLGILPTGSGKAISFFAAALLHPDKLFLVIIPLTALVEDMYRRLKQTRISGSIYPKCQPVTDRIIIVPSHLVPTDNFRNWSRGVNYRLQRIFMDESHQIYTSAFREGFDLLKMLTALKKPITFLSATVFPQSVDLLCRWMEIPRSILHEIRAPTMRTNIKYQVHYFSNDILLQNEIQKLVQSIELQPSERGLIYCRTVSNVQQLSLKLNLPDYYSKMNGDDTKNQEIKKQRQTQWRLGLQPSQRWIVATMGFGQGIDFSSVRHVIHYNVHGMMFFVQEVGRAGRDGLLSYSHVFYSQLPSILEDKKEDELQGDHTGIRAMRRFLTTPACRLLEFQPVNGLTHSCGALDKGANCDNCEELCKVCKSYMIRIYSLTCY